MTRDVDDRGAGAAGPLPRPVRPLRLGIVGGGRIAPVHAAAARGSGAWEVVAGAPSRDPDAGRRKGAEWRLDPERVYPTPAAMAEAERARPDGIDAAAVTTPNRSHYEITSAFLDAGVHVVCDKPLTTTGAEAADLVERARSRSLLLGVTYPAAGFPMVREAREIVAAGGLGPVRQVHVEYLQPPPDGDVGWRDAPELAGAAGTVADIGTHAFQLAEFVTGLRVGSIRADLVRTIPGRRLDDTAFVSLRFEGGVRGTLLLTQAAAWNDREVGLRVFGERGSVVWRQAEAESLRVARPGEPEQRLVAGTDGLHPRAAAFVAAPRGVPEGLAGAWANLYREYALMVEIFAGRADAGGLDRIYRIDGAQGARGVAFVEAAVASAADGRFTPVSAPAAIPS